MFVELTACRHLVVGSAYVVDEGWMNWTQTGAELVVVGSDWASVLMTPTPRPREQRVQRARVLLPTLPDWGRRAGSSS